MFANILGKRYRVVFTRMKNHDGWCDNPNTPHKKLSIDPCVRRNDQKYMEIVLHEALHAAVWSLDEEYVAGYAKDAARLLYRLGFRCVAEKGEG